MRLSYKSLATRVVLAFFPVLLSAQVFPPNADLSRSISLLTSQMQVKAMTVDATGNVYLAGITADGLAGATTSLGPRGDTDLFIIKTNNAADQIVYSTTIGGSFADSLTAIRVDINGNLYVLGSTSSLNFPFSSTVTPTNPVGAFILKLNSTGTAITYARQMGSRMNAQSFDIDAAGAAYISGVIISADLTPTAGVIKTTPGAGVGPDDATGFIAKLGTSGQSFDIATYFGALGKGVEFLSLRSNGVLVLSNGAFSLLNTSLTQQTATVATDLSPVRAAFDANGDIYLSGTSPTGFALRKHAAANLALLFDKSYPLSSSTVPPRIAVAPNGRIFLFGQPFSPNFATVNATQPCLANIAVPNGFAGLTGSEGSLIGALGSIPPDQALIILDASGNVLHSTFTTSIVSHAAIAPTTGRVYTSVVQNLFTQPDVTYWRGIVRFNQDLIPVEKASPSCIVLAAGTYLVAPLSPGAFMAVYGNHIGTPGFTLLTELTPAGLLPTVLGGASVTVDGRSAAISFSWDKQINFIVPWATRTDGAAVPVCVTFDGATTCVQASTAVAVPGAFPCDVNTGLSCALNPSGSTNGPSAPAKPGESVAFYMTGFGKVGGTLVDGGVYVAESRPLLGELTASTDLPPTGGCGIFGCPAQVAALQSNINVEYSGAAPGLALGVNQINLKIPADMADGLIPITLSFKPTGQQTAVTTVVRVQVKK